MAKGKSREKGWLCFQSLSAVMGRVQPARQTESECHICSITAPALSKPPPELLSSLSSPLNLRLPSSTI